MNTIKYQSLVFSILALALSGGYNFMAAQSSFSVSADTVFAIKPAHYFVFYNYVEFENNTDDTLWMRWKKTETISSIPGEPGHVWDIAIQDHAHFYNPANQLDSADFFIPTETGSTDKFLLHLFPNNLPGHLLVKFVFYPVANPADSATVVFDYTSTVVVDVTNLETTRGFSVFPNPASHFFHIENRSGEKNNFSISSPEAKVLDFFSLGPSETKRIDCTQWLAGVYFIAMEHENRIVLKQILISKN